MRDLHISSIIPAAESVSCSNRMFSSRSCQRWINVMSSLRPFAYQIIVNSVCIFTDFLSFPLTTVKVQDLAFEQKRNNCLPGAQCLPSTPGFQNLSVSLNNSIYQFGCRSERVGCGRAMALSSRSGPIHACWTPLLKRLFQPIYPPIIRCQIVPCLMSPRPPVDITNSLIPFGHPNSFHSTALSVVHCDTQVN